MDTILIFAGAIIFALGAASGIYAFKYSFRLAAQFQRVGHIEPPAPAPDKNSMPADPNFSAHRRAQEETLQNAAKDLMRMAAEAGSPITQQEAEEDAKRIIEALHGSTPLGGVS